MRAKALYAAGNFAARMGDFDRAEAFCKESLALFQEMGDRKKVGHAFVHLGFVACLNSELVAARTYFEESLAIAKEVEDKTDIGWPLWWLAYVIFYQGEHLRGLTLAEESLAFFRETGNAGGIAQTLWLLAQIHFYAQGDVVKALAIAEECLALAKEGDRVHEQGALDLLGQIALHEGTQRWRVRCLKRSRRSGTSRSRSKQRGPELPGCLPGTSGSARGRSCSSTCPLRGEPGILKR